MEKDPNEVKIKASLVWSRIGFYQQILLWIITAAIPFFIYLFYSINPLKYTSLSNWLSRVGDIITLRRFLPDYVIGLFIGAFLSLFFLLMEWLISRIKGELPKERLSHQDELIPKTSLQRRWAFAINLSASIMEEILFRGYLFMALINLWNHWLWAALLLSAIFAFFHTNIQQMSATVWIFITSLVLCYFTVTRRSLVIPWGIHFSVNLVNLFVFPKVGEYFSHENK
ncbi:MAG: type II CAAX endopeptidase family protein [Candidatus Marinimicrobia bacterium]|nr:type II CAAX endopeptidase family protein [Candidatus Neomarinimicrobiota bacterium]MDD5582075.1 type II CAAX endopeptidase family protein [Candidatus Neomarinimicrobiota bacterium]